MDNESVYYPVGDAEALKEFDLKEFGDIENPDFAITPEMKKEIAGLASFRLENANQFIERCEYDVAVEVAKSAVWLLEILNRHFPYEEQNK